MSTESLRTKRTNVSSQLLHDLRSPLTQIIGYSEMMTEESAQPREAFIIDLQRVRDAGYRMLALIEEHFTVASDKRLPRQIVAPIVDDSLFDKDVDESEQPASGLLLIVDDDAANRDVLSRRVTRQGHRVVTASSGREALELMRQTEFDAVLLDIMMPDVDGYAVLGEIKRDERLRHVPVIMISAIDEVQSVVRCIEAGADDYLTKPFDPTLLKARLGASLEKKRSRDREAVLYERLQQNFTRLQQLEQARDDMRNMIVHDLRTPLTAVIAGVEMLRSHGALSETQRELVTIAAGGGRTLLSMINDLLDVEKMESGTTKLKYAALPALAIATAAAEQVRVLADIERTEIVIDVDAQLPPFAGDENLLTRALVNLIANAVKFTRAGKVFVSASQAGSHIRFAVRDTGAGIPEEAFAQIFEKFGQVDAQSRVGTGLGLAFCKLAVEAHGGTIAVESTPGVGSTFSFTIPLIAISGIV